MENQNKKKLGWIAAAVATLSLGIAGIAAAHEGRDGKDGKEGKDWQARKAEMLKKYDTNGDGKLDEAERAVMRTEHLTQMFQKLDVNKDGVLSLDEFKAFTPMGGGHGFRGHHGHHDQGPAGDDDSK